MTERRVEDRRTRKQRVTRAAIVAAAQRLFAEEGFHPVSVQRIADEADVVVATLFNHFPSKQALFFEGRCPWLLLATRELPDLAERPPFTVGDVLDRVAGVVLDHVGRPPTAARRPGVRDLLSDGSLRRWERQLHGQAETTLAGVLAHPELDGAVGDPRRAAALVLAEARVTVEEHRRVAAGETPVPGPAPAGGLRDRLELVSTVF